MLSKDPIALGLALLLVGGLLVRFPTRQRVEVWINQQEETLIQMKQAAW
jgi:hypothetical protein